MLPVAESVFPPAPVFVEQYADHPFRRGFVPVEDIRYEAFACSNLLGNKQGEFAGFIVVLPL